MGAPAFEVPKRVRDTLRSQGAYDFGLGVVLRSPSDPKGAGAAASYRVEYRVEPVIPGRPLADRKWRYARGIEKAYVIATEVAEEMRERAGGSFVEYHTDVCFGEVVTRWMDAPHPRWGEQYPDKVRSLLKNWVLAVGITVPWPSRSAGTPIARVPIGALTADHYNQALEHVRAARAHRTYTEVHGLVVQILKWAIANRYLRPHDQNTLAHLHLAREQRAEHGEGMVRAIAPDEIPSTVMVEQLAAAAYRRFDQRTATMLHLLAYAGPRISECLALRNDDRFRFGNDGCWHIEIREQVHKSARRTLPPKWRKRRWTFVPHWLTDDVTRLLGDAAPGELLFPSPGRKVRSTARVIERVGAGLHPYSNWHERVWLKIVADTDGWQERPDWWPPEQGTAPPGRQSERRWLWPVHALRHVCATYQLNVLGLDSDDVAKFLGHRSGVQVWEMYVRVRPDLFGRAAEASRRAGDPRAGSSAPHGPSARLSPRPTGT